MTHTEQVWNALKASKRADGLGVPTLVRLTGLERKQVMTALRKLKDVKHVTVQFGQVEDSYMVGRYKAVKGIKRLPDGRGHHPNSRAELIPAVLGATKRVRRIKSAPIAICATELGKLWKPMAISILANE